MRNLLLAAISALAALPAQQPAPRAEKAERSAAPAAGRPTAGEDKRAPALRRLRADLQKLGDELNAKPHAYRGTLTFALPNGALRDLDLAFAGGCDERTSWFEIDDWRVVQRGDRSVASREQMAWQQPQGEAPECPLSPRLLRAHLNTAELELPRPTAVDGRPALQVHLTWRGVAARDVICATMTPSSDHEQLLDGIAIHAKRQREDVVVDGTLRYDPATARWLSTTLRFALVDGEQIADDDDKPDAPAGLPQLDSRPLMQVIWTLRRCAREDVPRYALDDEATRVLGLDEQRRK